MTLAPIDMPPRLRELAETFPTLTRALERGELKTIDDLDAARRSASHGEALILVFLLNVYSIAGWLDHSRDDEWNWPAFHLMDAMTTWDEAHRKAFAAWALEPWWC